VGTKHGKCRVIRTYFVFFVAMATSLSLASRLGSSTMPLSAFWGLAMTFLTDWTGCLTAVRRGMREVSLTRDGFPSRASM